MVVRRVAVVVMAMIGRVRMAGMIVRLFGAGGMRRRA